MEKTVDLTVLYTKVCLRGTGDKAYVLVPCKPLKGEYDEKNHIFKAGTKKFHSIYDDDSLNMDTSLYYGDVRRCVENEAEAELKKIFAEYMSFVYLKKRGTEAIYIDAADIIDKCNNPNTEITYDPNEYIVSYVDSALALSGIELEPQTLSRLETFYGMLDLFCNADGTIADIRLNDLNEDTKEYVYSSLPILLQILENNNVSVETFVTVEDGISKVQKRMYIEDDIDNLYNDDLYGTGVNQDNMEDEEKNQEELQDKIDEVLDNPKTDDGKVEEPENDNGEKESKEHKEKTIKPVPNKKKNQNVKQPTKIIYPEFSFQDVYDGITAVVKNQDEPIYKILSILYKKLIQLKIDEDKRVNNAILVTGSTGVGKSEIFKTFASLTDMPIEFMDATQLTAQGYVGGSIEDYLLDLLMKCDGNLEKAKRSLIILDEVDKIKANQEIGKDVNGKAVQDMFLKFLDGTDYYLRDEHKNISKVLNSKSMTNISMGAFSDLYNNLGKNSIGYGSMSASKEPTLKDFTDYGMKDEFMGRHSIIIRLNNLNIDALLNILNTSTKSPLLLQRTIFENMGIDVMFMPGYRKAVAEEAMRRNIGARALNAIVEETTFEPILEIEKNKGKYNRIIFDEDTVKDPKKYVLRRD